jgi:hypothetical protein
MMAYAVVAAYTKKKTRLTGTIKSRSSKRYSAITEIIKATITIVLSRLVVHATRISSFIW